MSMISKPLDMLNVLNIEEIINLILVSIIKLIEYDLNMENYLVSNQLRID